MEIQVQILSLAPLTCLEKFLIAGSSPAHTANFYFMGLSLIIGRAPDLHSGGEEIVAP